MSIQIYVEGGGDQRKTLDDCRRAFGELFAKVVPMGRRPRVIACGSRISAFKDFRTAIEVNREQQVLLLVDSESPVAPESSAWGHLASRPGDGWTQPPNTTDDQAHLMVQCMEAWILADRETVSAFYGDGFLRNSLPAQSNVEMVAKNDLIESLERASRPTQKGKYRKTKHGFDLLATIDPAKVRRASRFGNRLFLMIEKQDSP